MIPLRANVEILALLALVVAAPDAETDDWPHWRGPARNGVSTESDWIHTWPNGGPPIVWRAKVGTGFSSFSVAGGRLYVSGNEDNTDTIFCLDALKGRKVWSHSYPSDLALPG